MKKDIKKNDKKLALHPETVKRLSDGELPLIVGGAPPTIRSIVLACE